MNTLKTGVLLVALTMILLYAGQARDQQKSGRGTWHPLPPGAPFDCAPDRQDRRGNQCRVTSRRSLRLLAAGKSLR